MAVSLGVDSGAGAGVADSSRVASVATSVAVTATGAGSPWPVHAATTENHATRRMIRAIRITIAEGSDAAAPRSHSPNQRPNHSTTRS